MNPTNPNPITGEGDWIIEQQRVIRELSPQYLGAVFLKKEATPESNPSRQNTSPGPSTMAELATALRHPLPPPPSRPRCYSALEAMREWKPLTMEKVRKVMAKESAARDMILQEYTKRTGQAVDYCEECDMGVVEEEIEDGWQTVVVESECKACDGMGVVAI